MEKNLPICEIRELGPIYHIDESPKNIDDQTDSQLIELLKETIVVMGCFEWGLICELPFNKMNDDYFLFENVDPNACCGYIAWSGIEIVLIHNDIIYMRKFLDDDSLYIDKDITFTSPIIYKNEGRPNNFNGYLESTFDGFDGIGVKLMFKLDWFKNLFQNSNKHLVVLN